MPKEFNWDAYDKADEKKPEFNWDAYDQDPRDNPSALESGFRGGIKGASFGFADELGGGLEALGSLVGVRGLGGNFSDIRKETPEETSQSFGDVYTQQRDVRRERDQVAAAANPKSFMAGEIGGGVTTAIGSGGLGIVGKGAKASTAGAGRILGSAAAEGALYGAGEAENAGDIALDSAKGAGVGLLGGAVGMGATKLATKAGQKSGDVLEYLSEKFSPKIKEYAESRATKAAVGNQAKYTKELMGKGKYNETGRVLLDEGIVSGRFGKSPAQIAESSAEARKAIGKGYSTLYNKIDEAGEAMVDGNDIAMRMLDFAAKNESPANRGMVNNIMQQAEEFQNMGRIPLSEANRLQKTYKYKFGDPNSMGLGQEGTNAIKKSIKDSMRDTVKAVGGDSADVLKELDKKFSAMATTSKASEVLAGRMQGNRTVSLTDYLAAGAGAASGGGFTGSLGLAQANKFLRTRGSSMAAVGADKISNILQSSPQSFGKFSAPLQKAAERGQTALGASHYILWSNDPEYREMWEGGLATALDQ